MNNPQFYIFGVPDGFDMYNATPERQDLFQLLYDGDCRDKRKMAIYRNADNTEVSYIYLRYNMLSVKGRPNSFLGMALTFSEGYYCKDIPKLLNLFEEIYSALSKDVILTTRINPTIGQARYRIGRFAEGTAAIIKIEEFVEAQTRGWFGDCVLPMDETFRLNTQSVSLKQGLYLDTKSEHIIANMKTASWVYLSEPTSQTSPVSNPQPTPQPSPTPSPQPAPAPTPTPNPQPAPIVDPNIVAEQERQQKKLKELVAKFKPLHNSISNKQSADELTKKRTDLRNLQTQLNTLQYAIATKEGNHLMTLIGTDINWIDATLQNKRKLKNILFATAGILALVALLIILWPKGEEKGPNFDKQPIQEYADSLNKELDKINSSLMDMDESLKSSSNYNEMRQLLYNTQDTIKLLKDYLVKEEVDQDRILSLKEHAKDSMDKLTNAYEAFSKEKTATATTAATTATTATTATATTTATTATATTTATSPLIQFKVNDQMLGSSHQTGTYEFTVEVPKGNVKIDVLNHRQPHNAKWSSTSTTLSFSQTAQNITKTINKTEMITVQPEHTQLTYKIKLRVK